MDHYFIYDSPVSGRNFVGRKKDIALLTNLINGCESVALYGEPHTGKMSLVLQTLSEMKMNGAKSVTARVSLGCARTLEDLLLKTAGAVLQACAIDASEEGYSLLVRECLQDTHLVFDKERFRASGETVSANWLLDEVDIQKVAALPRTLALRFGIRLVVLFEQFQSVLFCEECDSFLNALEKEIALRSECVSFIFTGSHLNAMKEIFVGRRFCWRSVTRFEMSPIEASEITDYMYKGLMNTGKVAQKEQVMDICEVLRCNPWYLNHLFSIVESICRGYANRAILDEALRMLIAAHRPYFYSVVCSLTDFQLRMLRAIVDGETRFSSLGVIERYRLNSSANVKRLKDALAKKEVVWFDSQDEPHIQDPLFEYWLVNRYFADK